MTRRPLRDARPLVVAHRAANDPARVRAAIDAGADMVEADVWLDRGRVEVRHTKTMGPVPLLWDRWSLAPGWTPRLLLRDLLAALPDGAGLMLDLKGHDRGLAPAIVDALASSSYGGPVAVCTRVWPLLAPLAAHDDIALLYSAGNRRELRQLLEHGTPTRAEGVSVHRRLLDAPTVAALHRIAPLVATWPVNDIARLDALLDWGVSGVTTDELSIVREAAQRRAAAP